MKKQIVIGAAVVIALGGWYAFRPERLFVDQTVAETFEATGGERGPSALLSGSFHSVAHESRGIATIYESGNGERTLRLTQFETSNGPDVHIYLVAAADASDNETVTGAGFIDLGSMKGNVGDQNYAVPADVDLTQYRAVTVWCKRFGVNFGTAPLMVATGEAAAAADAADTGATEHDVVRMAGDDFAAQEVAQVVRATVRARSTLASGD